MLVRLFRGCFQGEKHQARGVTPDGSKAREPGVKGSSFSASTIRQVSHRSDGFDVGALPALDRPGLQETLKKFKGASVAAALILDDSLPSKRTGAQRNFPPGLRLLWLELCDKCSADVQGEIGLQDTFLSLLGGGLQWHWPDLDLRTDLEAAARCAGERHYCSIQHRVQLPAAGASLATRTAAVVAKARESRTGGAPAVLEIRSCDFRTGRASKRKPGVLVVLRDTGCRSAAGPAAPLPATLPTPPPQLPPPAPQAPAVAAPVSLAQLSSKSSPPAPETQGCVTCGGKARAQPSPVAGAPEESGCSRVEEEAQSIGGRSAINSRAAETLVAASIPVIIMAFMLDRNGSPGTEMLYLNSKGREYMSLDTDSDMPPVDVRRLLLTLLEDSGRDLSAALAAAASDEGFTLTVRAPSRLSPEVWMRSTELHALAQLHTQHQQELEGALWGTETGPEGQPVGASAEVEMSQRAYELEFMTSIGSLTKNGPTMNGIAECPSSDEFESADALSSQTKLALRDGKAGPAAAKRPGGRSGKIRQSLRDQLQGQGLGQSLPLPQHQPQQQQQQQHGGFRDQGQVQGIPSRQDSVTFSEGQGPSQVAGGPSRSKASLSVTSRQLLQRGSFNSSIGVVSSRGDSFAVSSTQDSNTHARYGSGVLAGAGVAVAAAAAAAGRQVRAVSGGAAGSRVGAFGAAAGATANAADDAAEQFDMMLLQRVASITTPKQARDVAFQRACSPGRARSAQAGLGLGSGQHMDRLETLKTTFTGASLAQDMPASGPGTAAGADGAEEAAATAGATAHRGLGGAIRGSERALSSLLDQQSRSGWAGGGKSHGLASEVTSRPGECQGLASGTEDTGLLPTCGLPTAACGLAAGPGGVASAEGRVTFIGPIADAGDGTAGGSAAATTSASLYGGRLRKPLHRVVTTAAVDLASRITRVGALAGLPPAAALPSYTQQQQQQQQEEPLVPCSAASYSGPQCTGIMPALAQLQAAFKNVGSGPDAGLGAPGRAGVAAAGSGSDRSGENDASAQRGAGGPAQAGALPPGLMMDVAGGSSGQAPRGRLAAGPREFAKNDGGPGARAASSLLSPGSSPVEAGIGRFGRSISAAPERQEISPQARTSMGRDTGKGSPGAAAEPKVTMNRWASCETSPETSAAAALAGFMPSHPMGADPQRSAAPSRDGSPQSPRAQLQAARQASALSGRAPLAPGGRMSLPQVMDSSGGRSQPQASGLGGGAAMGSPTEAARKRSFDLPLSARGADGAARSHRMSGGPALNVNGLPSYAARKRSFDLKAPPHLPFRHNGSHNGGGHAGKVAFGAREEEGPRMARMSRPDDPLASTVAGGSGIRPVTGFGPGPQAQPEPREDSGGGDAGRGDAAPPGSAGPTSGSCGAGQSDHHITTSASGFHNATEAPVMPHPLSSPSWMLPLCPELDAAAPLPMVQQQLSASCSHAGPFLVVSHSHGHAHAHPHAHPHPNPHHPLLAAQNSSSSLLISSVLQSGGTLRSSGSHHGHPSHPSHSHSPALSWLVHPPVHPLPGVAAPPSALSSAEPMAAATADRHPLEPPMVSSGQLIAELSHFRRRSGSVARAPFGVHHMAVRRRSIGPYPMAAFHPSTLPTAPAAAPPTGRPAGSAAAAAAAASGAGGACHGSMSEDPRTSLHKQPSFSSLMIDGSLDDRNNGGSGWAAWGSSRVRSALDVSFAARVVGNSEEHIKASAADTRACGVEAPEGPNAAACASAFASAAASAASAVSSGAPISCPHHLSAANAVGMAQAGGLDGTPVTAALPVNLVQRAKSGPKYSGRLCSGPVSMGLPITTGPLPASNKRPNSVRSRMFSLLELMDGGSSGASGGAGEQSGVFLGSQLPLAGLSYRRASAVVSPTGARGGASTRRASMAMLEDVVNGGSLSNKLKELASLQGSVHPGGGVSGAGAMVSIGSGGSELASGPSRVLLLPGRGSLLEGGTTLNAILAHVSDGTCGTPLGPHPAHSGAARNAQPQVHSAQNSGPTSANTSGHQHVIQNTRPHARTASHPQNLELGSPAGCLISVDSSRRRSSRWDAYGSAALGGASSLGSWTLRRRATATVTVPADRGSGPGTDSDQQQQMMNSSRSQSRPQSQSQVLQQHPQLQPSPSPPQQPPYLGPSAPSSSTHRPVRARSTVMVPIEVASNLEGAATTSEGMTHEPIVPFVGSTDPATVPALMFQPQPAHQAWFRLHLRCVHQLGELGGPARGGGGRSERGGRDGRVGNGDRGGAEGEAEGEGHSRRPSTLMLVMQDVTAQMMAQERVAALLGHEHKILEALFPRHVIEFMTVLPAGLQGDAPGPGRLTSRRRNDIPSDAGPAGSAAAQPPGALAAAASQGAGGQGPGAGAQAPGQPGQLGDGSSGEMTAAEWRKLIMQQQLDVIKVSHLATKHKMCTILFSDCVGFTAMCKMVSPYTVMHFLNELYQKLDALLDIYKVYKVETIGDCYVVAGGLVRHDADGYCSVLPDGEVDELHAVRVMQFAKAMLRVSREVLMPTTSEPVQLRLGIHSGPVMSGVVGSKMPRFTVFGETVEVAHKMESGGRPGRIHVSGVAKALLRREQWELLGDVQINGRERLDTYLWVEEEDEISKQRVLAVYT